MTDNYQITNIRETHEDAMRMRDECGKLVAEWLQGRGTS